MFDLNINLKNVDTSFPSIAVGDVLSSVLSVVPEESKKTPGLWMLKVSFETLAPTTDTKGKDLPPGFKYAARITLPGQSGAEEHDEMRLKSLCLFIDGCLGTSTEAGDRPGLNEAMSLVVGKQVLVSFKKSKDDQFGETEVKGYKHVQA